MANFINKELRQVHLVLFYDFWKISNLLKVANVFDDFFGEYFDGKKTVLPNDEQMPPEIPRIILNSKEGKDTLNIGPQRADIIITGIKEEIMSLAIDKINKFAEISVEELDWTINRLGAISNYIIEFKESSICFLEKKYFKNNIQKGTIKNEFHSLIRKNWQQNKTINQWIRLSAEEDKLQVIIDRNLVPDENEISLTLIKKYFDDFKMMQSEIINDII